MIHKKYYDVDFFIDRENKHFYPEMLNKKFTFQNKCLRINQKQ